ncbi:MAG: GNAT family N-acetyltransferase [Paenibacillus sp.]|nr:GNAT family N-acetyltransferase [Paenibacillus sp.]
MNITYKINAPLEAAEVAEIFKSSGIKRPVDDLNRIGKMIANADVLVSAWDGENPVGIARAITDHVYCCYLSDLAVRMDYQKMGIGKELVNVLKGHLGKEVMLLLLAAPSAMEYYPKIGFDKLDSAFIVARAK